MELRNPFSARRSIRSFACELSGRCGVDPRYLEKDIIKAKRLNHISLGEYEWMGYYALSPAQKRSMSTLWTRAELRKKYTKRLYKGVLMDKYVFSKVFAQYYGRKCLLSQEITRDELDGLAGEAGKVVYKPISKGSGTGVRIIKAATAQERDEAFSKLRALPRGIVEEWIQQHEVLNTLNPGAVSIVRFYSVCTPAGCYLFAPVLTTAITRSIANGCQDALTAIADIRTGLVITDAVDQNKLTECKTHPVTGTPFKGLQLPYWDETIAMMKKVVPQAWYISNIGWDVAITDHGPVLVEANTIPGFNTAQYRGFAGVTNGWGYQPIFDEAMKGIPFTGMENYEKVLIKLA